MEENERYLDREVSTETDYYTSIYDTEKNIDFFDEDIIPLLNQQDKEIKRLINLNKEVIIQNKNILNDAKEIEQENQQLKEKLNNFETCMKKYNVEDIELLDLMLFVLSGETKYHLKEIKDKHKKELEQSQKQLAIEELKKLEYSVLDFSNGYWRYFMTDGCEYMLSKDLEDCLKEYIDNQIKNLMDKE